DQTPEKGGFNLSRWVSPDYDKLNDQQLVEFDDAKRMALIEQASDIVNDEVAECVLFFPKGATGSATTLHNFTPNAYGDFWQAPFVWIDQK
ncbi:MAG TPA: hypothetical protein VFQ54_02775, partial [Thermomicrobiales bacterium]|nr:hypothetical protein [Thermomicrobiales bacterium]